MTEVLFEAGFPPPFKISWTPTFNLDMLDSEAWKPNEFAFALGARVLTPDSAERFSQGCEFTEMVGASRALLFSWKDLEIQEATSDKYCTCTSEEG